MTPSHDTWRRVVKQAHDGDPRHLMELLLQPHTTDGQGRPLGFYSLPDDAVLRFDIVRVLMLGPWKSATTLGELLTKTGWGKTKPAVSDLEVQFAALAEWLGDDLEGHAAALGVDADTLRRRIKQQRK